MKAQGTTKQALGLLHASDQEGKAWKKEHCSAPGDPEQRPRPPAGDVTKAGTPRPEEPPSPGVLWARPRARRRRGTCVVRADVSDWAGGCGPTVGSSGSSRPLNALCTQQLQRPGGSEPSWRPRAGPTSVLKEGSLGVGVGLPVFSPAP